MNCRSCLCVITHYIRVKRHTRKYVFHPKKAFVCPCVFCAKRYFRRFINAIFTRQTGKYKSKCYYVRRLKGLISSASSSRFAASYIDEDEERSWKMFVLCAITKRDNSRFVEHRFHRDGWRSGKGVGVGLVRREWIICISGRRVRAVQQKRLSQFIKKAQ